MAGKKLSRRDRIKKGIRKRLTGSESRPRLSVYRSNKGIYAQIINDVTGNTIVSASSLSKEEKTNLLQQLTNYYFFRNSFSVGFVVFDDSVA